MGYQRCRDPTSWAAEGYWAACSPATAQRWGRSSWILLCGQLSTRGKTSVILLMRAMIPRARVQSDSGVERPQSKEVPRCASEPALRR